MKFIDVCAGIGGFRMGMEKSGHECVYTIEYDDKAIKAHNSIWGYEENAHYGDMRDLNYNELPDFDALCAGFPCAKFSIAGDRMGFESEDPRATVFFELMKIVDAKKPKILFFENVKGLLNHDEGKSFGAIIYEMGKRGYNVEWQVINAKDQGSGAIRERVFIIGHLKEWNSERRVFPFEYSVRKDDSKTLVYQFRRGHFRTFKGYFPTLTASMGTGGNNVPFIIDSGRLRKITPKECFMLQGIPMKYIDKLINSGLPNSALYERAGRTVYVPIISMIAKRIKEIDDNKNI